MKIPRFWARSESQSAGRGQPPLAVGCWKWSDVSVEEARRLADARALELGRILREGRPLDRYLYGEQPLREEVIRTIQPEVAVITRNRYGALVLNAARAMFIDVDF